MAQSFDYPDSLVRLDELQLDHHRKYQAVKEYENTEKPKLYMRANYPVDIINTGPLIRTWAMTFEAMLQMLKKIAAHSNYKDVIHRC